MNIQTVLDTADKMLPNLMDRQLKLRFLTEIEQKIWSEIICRHERPGQRKQTWTEDETTIDLYAHLRGNRQQAEEQEEKPPVYTVNTDPGTELLAPDANYMLYVYWILRRIDEQNLEFDKMNSHQMLFENEYGTFDDWYTRTHMPLGVPQLRI